jgi:hypothetical protein
VGVAGEEAIGQILAEVLEGGGGFVAEGYCAFRFLGGFGCLGGEAVFGGVGGGTGAAFGGFGACGEAAIGGAGDLARGELSFHGLLTYYRFSCGTALLFPRG